MEDAGKVGECCEFLNRRACVSFMHILMGKGNGNGDRIRTWKGPKRTKIYVQTDRTKSIENFENRFVEHPACESECSGLGVGKLTFWLHRRNQQNLLQNVCLITASTGAGGEVYPLFPLIIIFFWEKKGFRLSGVWTTPPCFILWVK
jgi:hypothetical protein